MIRCANQTIIVLIFWKMCMKIWTNFMLIIQNALKISFEIFRAIYTMKTITGSIVVKLLWRDETANFTSMNQFVQSLIDIMTVIVETITMTEHFWSHNYVKSFVEVLIFLKCELRNLYNRVHRLWITWSGASYMRFSWTDQSSVNDRARSFLNLDQHWHLFRKWKHPSIWSNHALKFHLDRNVKFSLILAWNFTFIATWNFTFILTRNFIIAAWNFIFFS